jgi:hypothetical protein
MKRHSVIRVLSLALVLIVAVIADSPAYAVTAEALCTGSNGTWDGTSSSTGTCTYAPDESITISSCGSSRYTYIITYTAGIETSAVCKPLHGGGYTAVTSDGAQANSFTLHLKNGKGYVTFAAGCNQNCAINSTLAELGRDTIYVTPLATMYVRTGRGSVDYTVCFNNPNRQSVRIYRYIQGIWTPVNAPSTNAQVCASASRDGSFFLH